MSKEEAKDQLLQSIKEVIIKAKHLTYQHTNTILLNMYWEIGRLIVEDEQHGKAKASYGKAVLKTISRQLTIEFGKGFDESNLRNIRQFYLAFRKRDALRHELSWTHYRLISRIDNEPLRLKYMQFAVDGAWNTRTLERNIRTQYVGRIIDYEKDGKPAAQNLFKDPYILEFLGLPTDTQVSESKIESALINNLQQFLMELGKGFAFVARQQHIVTDTSDFYIDLVFYNYYLKCFVLIDLKTDKLTHAAIGQMDMYVRMYDDLKTSEGDSPTIGIILCTEKDETVVKYSVLAENEQLFASKYRLYLPSEEELAQLIEANRVHFQLDNSEPSN